MIPPGIYIKNLILAERFKKIDGAVVECGVWRGGMISGIAKLFRDSRDYYLFDSFEGLPPAEDIDGEAIKYWQYNKKSLYYHDNCRADESYARKAMLLSGARNFYIFKGWFNQTLLSFTMTKKIAILRIDADLYDSTLECLNSLYKYVALGGLIIIDDYGVWDGCSRAVHYFLAQHNLPEKIQQFDNTIFYIIKKSK